MELFTKTCLSLTFLKSSKHLIDKFVRNRKWLLINFPPRAKIISNSISNSLPEPFIKINLTKEFDCPTPFAQNHSLFHRLSPSIFTPLHVKTPLSSNKNRVLQRSKTFRDVLRVLLQILNSRRVHTCVASLQTHEANRTRSIPNRC